MGQRRPHVFGSKRKRMEDRLTLARFRVAKQLEGSGILLALECILI